MKLKKNVVKVTGIAALSLGILAGCSEETGASEDEFLTNDEAGQFYTEEELNTWAEENGYVDEEELNLWAEENGLLE
ncbi:hypothetical protein [Virgibacillus sp. DJP39]|uniref:hypothetical protein n=1 Tax=Virgibacillus sp. DJP39 TaxID=3409790 RepID=UPI003BB63F4A